MVSLKKALPGAVLVLILMPLFGTAACGGDNDGSNDGAKSEDNGTDDKPSDSKECTALAAEAESSCTYCAATSCCDAFMKCAGLSACSDLVSCIDDCESDSCLANCEKLYPTGITPLNVYYECVADKCKSQCAASA